MPREISLSSIYCITPNSSQYESRYIFSSQNCIFVIKVDKLKDLILLETDKDVCEVPPRLASPEEGEEYFQLGLSALTQENPPFSVTRGVFISREFSVGTSHYLGSAGSNPGDSGGGLCFSETQNLLFGINV